MRHIIFASVYFFLSMPIGVYGFTLDEAEEALRNLQFETVLKTLNPRDFDKAEDKQYALFLLGTAAFHNKDYTRALANFAGITSEYPDSRWFVKATYKKAECLMNLKRYDEAEVIYAKGIEGLMSEERRSEIAGIYIQHANRFFAPNKKGEQPDYERALKLYEFARDVLPKGRAWERVSYQIAMTRFNTGQWDDAQQHFNQLIAYYEDAVKPAAGVVEESSSEIPNPYPKGGYIDHAMLHRGEAFFQLGNKVEARRIWKKLRAPERKNTNDPSIVADAAFRIGKTYDMPEPDNDKDLALGARYLEEYVERFPEHEKVPTAALDIAKGYYKRHQYEKALNASKTVLEKYTKRGTPQQNAYAEFLTARCLLDMERFDDAIEAFDNFLTHHPMDENWQEAQQSIVYTRYRKVKKEQQQADRALALWIRDTRLEDKDPEKETIPQDLIDRYKEVRNKWENYQETYPLDSKIATIQLLLGKNERQLRRYDEAMGIWKDLASRYPKSDQASEALYLIAETTETNLVDYDKALDLYGEVTFGPYQGSAQERIRALKEVYLFVNTKRAFHTDEKPSVRVNTRNIEHLTCKLYPLDLQTYFQSKHTIRNIEDLDIDLIAPETIWQVTQENYRAYKADERDIAIPVEKAGAWVVKVESDELEAATLLLVSDLAVAIKGGKNEIFVYAEDQRREQAMPDTEVFVSDGQSIVAQGKTNNDGVFHTQSYNKPVDNQLSVFAAYQNNWAGEFLNIQNLSGKTSLQPRVFIYTGQPVYQPGDTVDYRALIREIENGQYIIPSEYEYQVTAVDARGLVIFEQKNKLSEFGTLNGRFTIAESSSYGQYRIMVTRKDGPTGSWQFGVQEFTLPTAQVKVEPEQTTYFYGDEIAGTIKIMDFSGNPLPNERIQYSINGISEVRDGVSNDKGEIKFRFETWDMPEVGNFQITGILASRQLQGSKTVMLVNTGFYITLNTTRNTYLTGEPFHIDVNAFSRDEKSERLEKSLKLILQKRTDEGSFTTVGEKTLQTSSDERKTTSVSFTADTGGQYQVVAEGTDQRGTQVTSQKRITISGEDDANKLLILSDRSLYQQGETATFTVVSRMPENLCLITGEREGVVEYRLEKLQKGKNTVSWKLDDRYSPTATVSLIVMHDNQFYQRDAYFQVHRGLDLAITPNRESYRPGDETELLVEAKDHTGKPVVAEFSLGLIDAALLSIFPDQIVDLAQVFEQAGQGRFIATNSSAGFSYEGKTGPISKDYLEELAARGESVLSDEETGGGLRGGRMLRERLEESRKSLREAEEQARLRVAEAAHPEAPASAALDLKQNSFQSLGVARRKAGQIVQGIGMAGKPQVMDQFGDTFKQSGDMNGDGVIQMEGAAPQDTPNHVVYFNTVNGPALQAGEPVASIPLQFSFVRHLADSKEVSDKLFAGGYARFGTITADFSGLVPTGGMATTIRSYFPETAYFNAAVITDENGKASIRVKLPDSLTTWEAQARAITKDTLVNQAQKLITVDKPFRVEIETPPFLTEGDESSGIAIVKNNTDNEQKVKTTLTQTVNGKQNQSGWTADLKQNGVDKHTFTLTTGTAGPTSLTLKSESDSTGDAAVMPLSVMPWGIPIRSGKSGITNQSVVETVSLPSQADYSRVKMWLTLSGAGDLSLIAPVWEHPFDTHSNRAGIERGLAALAALDCAERLKKTDRVPMDTLRKQIESAVRFAAASQTDNGLWNWGGNRQSDSDILTTGRALELLHDAKEHGFTVPAQVLEKASARLEEAYRSSADDDEKTRILYAWSWIGDVDFTYVNRIHRNLTRLDSFNAALLGLTWFNMDRTEKATEVLNHLLQTSVTQETESTKRTVSNVIRVSPNESLAATARLYFLLPAMVRNDKQTKRFLDGLAADPIFPRMEVALPIGLRMQALAAYLLSAAEEQNAFSIAATLNGKPILNRRAERDAMPYERINIDPDLVKSSDNRLEINYEGQGTYRYSIVLEGWTKQEVQPQDWIEPQDRVVQTVDRSYTHGPLTYKNQDIPRGYSVVDGQVQPVVNDLKEIEPGDRINVRLRIDGRQSELSYLIVEDRIPAGFLLLENTIDGQVDHYELKDNTLTFYLRGPQRIYHVSYQLLGRFSGTYRVPAALVTVAESPEQLYASRSNEITILPEGEKPKTKYNPTPDELYNLGLRYYQDGLLDQAKTYLTELFNAVSLRPQEYLETAKMLFRIHLNGNDAQELVRYFEIIKERDRELEIAFSQICKLAQAYRSIGEHERAVYVYRSLFDGLFLQEGAVSGTLQEVLRHRESLDYMKQLILEYPDLPSVQNAVYTTGSMIYQNVNDWARQPEFVKAGNTKTALLAEAVGMIESFLALYPNHPLADEAGYTSINLWLDQKNFQTVTKLAGLFTQRYPQSTFLDSYDYLNAYSLFQMEQYDRALAVAKKVAEEDYPAPGGGLKKSEEATSAILMSGKILHASGKMDEALGKYEEVKQAFGDANKSIEFLTEKGLTLDDVSIFREGEAASIELRHKNLDQADLRVYKVDLMRFYLSEQNLDRMTRINLAGIDPAVEKTLDLKSAKRFEWNETRIDLPFKEPGAYLVVVGSNGLIASGMVLRSDLNLEVQEDAPIGLVRVNVSSASRDKFVKDVKVQVRGSRNQKFESGETDLRGIFTAVDVQGTATVLAQSGDQYGFYKGTIELGQQEKAEEKKVQQQVSKDGKAVELFDYDALGNNFDRMNKLQEVQIRRWNTATDPTNNRLTTQQVQSLY